jgi:hypothetical protein
MICQAMIICVWKAFEDEMMRSRNTVVALLIGGLISGCSHHSLITVHADESRCVQGGSLPGVTAQCERLRPGWEGASMGTLAVDLK